MALITACSDPADKVQKASTSEPEKKVSAEQAPQTASAKDYVIRNAESKVEFVGSKVTGKHDGGFKKFAGIIKIADGKIVGNPEVKISMPSIWADNERLTGHLKSGDFFDVEKFPVSTFTVTSIENTNVTGNLEMHGVTKSISFPADIHISTDAVTLNSEFAINRKDFNINYPGKPNDLIRDNVVLKLAIKATPGEPKPEDQL